MKVTLSVFALLCLATCAMGDWNPGMPAKWVQMPDLTFEGMDVRCTMPVLVGDDFLCTEEGLITGIHIWGSWRGDRLPFSIPGNPDPLMGDPMAVAFRLGIYSDIPAGIIGPDGQLTPWSQPGIPLWERFFQPGQFIARPYAMQLLEGWYDPSVPYYLFPGDTVCWQYNFRIPEEWAFLQVGTPQQPVVYWLVVEAFPMDMNEEIQFGWKTSKDHWNDDSTFIVEPILPFGWTELIHPEMQYSLDQAFVINSVPPIPPDNCWWGDYNQDGVVDLADYTVWADNFGKTGPPHIHGDGNGDGTVDLADYTIWADNFGRTSPPMVAS